LRQFEDVLDGEKKGIVEDQRHRGGSDHPTAFYPRSPSTARALPVHLGARSSSMPMPSRIVVVIPRPGRGIFRGCGPRAQVSPHMATRLCGTHAR
jgi:hypothetical protein